MLKLKYCPTYIKNLFIANEHGGEPLPHCVICMKTLCNSAVKPSLLKLHLVTNHMKEKEQDESYFSATWRECKKTTPRQEWRDLQKKNGVVKASHETALLVAKSMKALVIGESLVMPAAKILVKNVIGVEAAAKLKTVSLSNNAVEN